MSGRVQEHQDKERARAWPGCEGNSDTDVSKSCQSSVSRMTLPDRLFGVVQPNINRIYDSAENGNFMSVRS